MSDERGGRIGQRDAQAEPPRTRAASKRKLVVIDDDRELCQFLELVLRDAGYDVGVTSDPTEALGLVRRFAPDLVLCDLEMPVLDGYGVLKQLQDDPETAGYPVALFTARRQFTEKVKAFRFGVVDYLTKPFTPQVLLRRIERLLEDRQHRTGIVRRSGPAALETLLADARRDARSGIVSVTSATGCAPVVVKAGEAVEGPAPVTPSAETTAEFRELDPRREQIVSPPVDPQAVESEGWPSFEDVPQQLRSALVVDDDSAFRAQLAAILRGQGFTVHEAGDGAEALEVALAQRPWIILTDVRMPVLDGVELCRRLRSHSLIRHTPVVLLSGWDGFRERYRGLEAGADEYLYKLTPMRELLLRVHLLLRRYWETGRDGRDAAPGMRGRLELVGPPGLLQICHLGRLTGVLRVRDEDRETVVRWRQGEIVGAESAGVAGQEALCQFICWTQGQFEFQPGDPLPGEPLGESFQQVLLEACRLIDERQRAAP